MDAKTLMIGDWVLYRGTPKQVRYINDRISFDGRFHNDEIGFTHNEEEWINVCHSEPMPITEEFLLNNGFSRMWGKLRFRRGQLSMAYNFENVGYMGENYEVDMLEIKGMGLRFVKRDVKYVHELQQALRVCGLYDLADSFKVFV